MGLSFRYVVATSAPKRSRPIYSDASLNLSGLSFLCSERSRTVKTLRFAPARSPFRYRCSTATACLTPSLNLLSQPVFRVVRATNIATRARHARMRLRMQSRLPTPKQSGFSVIEVLLIVLVVAVLAATGIVVYQRHRPGNAATGSTQTT